MIPVIDAADLRSDVGARRESTDRAIAEAASSSGFFCIQGQADALPTARATREDLLRVFSLSDTEQRRLWRSFYAPENPNIYRGWNPRDGQVGVSIYDMGRDVAYASGRDDACMGDDPLLGATPFPLEDSLPGWRAATAAYYRSMEQVGALVMRSVARGLGLEETFFDAAFVGGLSTLRLMRYEFAPGESRPNSYGLVASDGERDVDPGLPRRGEHVDSGFVTLLCQHGVAGLSAKARSGAWVDVPPVDGQIVVNFGGLLERWTEGRIRATPHRVESVARQRFSIPFFFEPRVDTVIAPLPMPWATPFEPFSYGDHLWAAMAKFPNFAGIANLRSPRGPRLASP